jgi:hypothetical protein
VVNETIGTALRGAPKLLGAVSQEEIHKEMGGGTDTQYKSQNPTTALISTLVHCSPTGTDEKGRSKIGDVILLRVRCF